MRRTIEKLVFKKVFLCAFYDWTPVLGGVLILINLGIRPTHLMQQIV
jgi:hypothetical protein